MHILALSGSNRRASTNTSLLKALSAVAPEGMEITICDGLGQLPIFSPDLEGPDRPKAVSDFIARIKAADGVIIASPEYVRALPGGLKNALDWLVSGEELIGKPIALAHASHRGDDMLTDLRRVLSTLSTGFAADIFLRVPVMKSSPEDIHALVTHPDTAQDARAFLIRFSEWAHSLAPTR
ncbi:NAD(P)H-dependent FMN reductase [Celeribacter baekdonensis]|uniref:NAD(P)H-dependent FMN reductase n=1 Tax=Celeribacter baekdonensis TaxID=875171 RepID=A0A1G7GE65_9RHOB|nr:NADPH-dependent FMN reductase [Celeribacter baekdonensis]SDE86385.1 NAD(P)H-dependent FMN reductase [Celeribacter baekdonensis]